MNITYFTEGFEPASYVCHGELEFYESACTTLPGKINAKNGKNNFTVILDTPKGKTDPWDGEYVETHEYTGLKDSETGLKLGHLPEGRYVMDI